MVTAICYLIPLGTYGNKGRHWYLGSHCNIGILPSIQCLCGPAHAADFKLQIAQGVRLVHSAQGSCIFDSLFETELCLEPLPRAWIPGSNLGVPGNGMATISVSPKSAVRRAPDETSHR